jgi:lipoyl(octanoyl) transferase
LCWTSGDGILAEVESENLRFDVCPPACSIDVIDLGRLSYVAAYQEQVRHHELVLAARDPASPGPRGRVLCVEHDPVITVSRRAGAMRHVLASPESLAREGVEVRETDRGGDVTDHGPGQVVIYPIIDLNAFRLGLHDYMRMLEECVVRACASFGIVGERDPGATGVWVRRNAHEGTGSLAKLCAFGVRVRKWVSMHGLAVNVDTSLSHFQLIVPCGLAGRPVTSMRELLGERCPSMRSVRDAVVSELVRLLEDRAAHHAQRGASAGTA